MTDVPEIRIGHAERTEAESMLRQHLVAGRLTEGEFETRAQAAREAWTSSDLNVLFADLPGPKPVVEAGLWEQPDFSHRQLVDPRVNDPEPGPSSALSDYSAARPNYPAPTGRNHLAWIGPAIFGLVIVLLVVTGGFARMWWILFPMLFFFKWMFPSGRNHQNPQG